MHYLVNDTVCNVNYLEMRTTQTLKIIFAEQEDIVQRYCIKMIYYVYGQTLVKGTREYISGFLYCKINIIYFDHTQHTWQQAQNRQTKHYALSRYSMRQNNRKHSCSKIAFYDSFPRFITKGKTNQKSTGRDENIIYS